MGKDSARALGGFRERTFVEHGYIQAPQPLDGGQILRLIQAVKAHSGATSRLRVDFGNGATRGRLG